MERTAVTSSNIASIGYDPASQTVEVEFHEGGVFQYYEVPQEVYDDFLAADSKGKFFNQYIKHYNYAKL
jgi:hypothetical protein